MSRRNSNTLTIFCLAELFLWFSVKLTISRPVKLEFRSPGEMSTANLGTSDLQGYANAHTTTRSFPQPWGKYKQLFYVKTIFKKRGKLWNWGQLPVYNMPCFALAVLPSDYQQPVKCICQLECDTNRTSNLKIAYKWPFWIVQLLSLTSLAFVSRSKNNPS